MLPKGIPVEGAPSPGRSTVDRELSLLSLPGELPIDGLRENGWNTPARAS